MIGEIKKIIFVELTIHACGSVLVGKKYSNNKEKNVYNFTMYLVLTTVAVYLCCVKRRWVPIPDSTLPDLNLLSVPKGPASPAAGSRHNELYVLLLFLIYLFLTTDCCPTNYLNIYRTDLRQTFKVARRTKSALWLLIMGHYTHTLTYLLTYLLWV